jgi:N-sulfoglucosamine sulfohydrolase
MKRTRINLLAALLLLLLMVSRGADAPTASQRATPVIATLGEWTANKDARLSFVDNELRIESGGRDPWCFTREIPAAKGPLTLELSMKSTAKGDGQIFFTTAPKDGFGRAKVLNFAVTHDGEFHDYKISLGDAERVYALRIDPATAPGAMGVRTLVLRDGNGAVAKAWKFADAPAPVVVKHATPNVLLILIEDAGAHLGLLGTPGLSTPNLDALAHDSVLFRKYFVGYPVCSPSKACIYSGLYPHRNGLINNTENLFKPASEITTKERSLGAYAKNQIKPEVRTLAEILHERGYHMGVSGKLHVSPNEKFPYHEFIPGKNVVGAFIRRAQATGKPWFLFDNAHNEPHRPYVNSDAQPIGVDPAQVKLPAYLPDTPEIRKDWAEYLNGIQLADAEVGRAMQELKASGEFDNTLVIVMAGDHGPAFQHGKMTPYELGLHVPLIVRAPGGARDLQSDALTCEVDLMPTILDYLGTAPPQPLDGISLRPLIESKPGAKGHEHVFAEVSGRVPGSTRGMEERSVLDGRWHLIVRSKLDEPRIVGADSWQFETWRNRSYRETIRVKEQFPEPFRILAEMDPAKLGGKPPAFELYDLESDRDEMHNLANDPAHHTELERMFAALKKWSAETHDATAPLPALLAPSSN